MFMDELRAKVWEELRQHDFRLFGTVLTPSVLAEAAQRAGVRIGKGPLQVVNLVWLGVLAAFHTSKDFASIITLTFKLLGDQEGFAQTPLGQAQRGGKRRSGRPSRSKHDPRRADPTQVSEEAFTKARRRMPLAFWTALIVLLIDRFEETHADCLRWNGFRLLTMDGTCIDLDNWKRLRDYFGAARNRRGPQKTQARMVLLQFPLTRLPCAYEVVPLSVGETTVGMRLVERLRLNDLVLIDRGFFSYGLLARIHQRGAYFAIRLKKGIRLRRRRSLGHKDQLVRWRPRKVRQKPASGPLPDCLDLRMIRYQIPGYRASAVVTNVTDPSRISREDWVRLTTSSAAGKPLQPGLYHRRWEIETTFYELKVTQGMEGALRSRSPEGIAFEIAAHVVLYLTVRWLMVEAALKHGHDPLRLSFAEALREIEDIKPALLTATPAWASEVLLPRLLQRLASHQVPLRPGRHYPRPNDGKVKNRGRGQKQKPAKLKGKG